MLATGLCEVCSWPLVLEHLIGTYWLYVLLQCQYQALQSYLQMQNHWGMSERPSTLSEVHQFHGLNDGLMSLPRRRHCQLTCFSAKPSLLLNASHWPRRAVASYDLWPARSSTRLCLEITPPMKTAALPAVRFELTPDAAQGMTSPGALETSKLHPLRQQSMPTTC